MARSSMLRQQSPHAPLLQRRAQQNLSGRRRANVNAFSFSPPVEAWSIPQVEAERNLNRCFDLLFAELEFIAAVLQLPVIRARV